MSFPVYQYDCDLNCTTCGTSFDAGCDCEAGVYAWGAKAGDNVRKPDEIEHPARRQIGVGVLTMWGGCPKIGKGKSTAKRPGKGVTSDVTSGG